MTTERERSRRALQMRAPKDTFTMSHSRAKRHVSNSAQDTAILDFDNAYERTGSAIFRKQLTQIAEACDMIGASILMEKVAGKIMRSAYRSVLSNVGRYMTKYTSRTLIAMGIRTATARITSELLSRLTTRMLLIAGEAATGVGLVVAAIDLIALVLDVMLMFGWDPGNYNSEMDNAVYDDMTRAWNSIKERSERGIVDPLTVLMLFQTRNQRDDGDAAETSTAAVSTTTTRTRIRSIDSIPWYFAPFTDAVRTIADDEYNDDDGEQSDWSYAAADEHRRKREFHDDEPEDKLTRVRPITVPNNPSACNFIWSMQYFRHRRYNALGQRVDVGFGSGDDYLAVTDEVIERNMRDNELAFMLHTSGFNVGMPRARLVGACRRNVAQKTCSLIYGAVVSLGGVFTCGVLLSIPIKDAPLLCALSCLFVVPILLFIACCEIVLREDKSYDGEITIGRSGSEALAIEICDAIVTFVANNTEDKSYLDFVRSNLYEALMNEMKILDYDDIPRDDERGGDI